MAQVWDPRLIRSRKVGFFIQAMMSLYNECAPYLRFIDLIAIDSGNEHAQRNIGFKTLRLVYAYITPCNM
jgi:hypothetical protein